MLRLTVIVSGEVEKSLVERKGRFGLSYSEMVRNALMDSLKLEGVSHGE